MSELSIKSGKNYSLLIASVATSIALHALGFYFLATQPMILSHPLRLLFGISPSSPTYLDTAQETLEQQDHLLKEVFDHILVLSPHLQQPFDLLELPCSLAIAPSKEHAEIGELSFTDKEFPQLLQENLNVGTLTIEDCKTDAPALALIAPSCKAASFQPLALNVESAVHSYAIEQIDLPQKESPYILDETLVANRQTQASLEPNSDTADIASDLLAQSSTYALHVWDSKEDEIRKEIEFIIDPSAEQPPFFSRPSLTKAYTPHPYVCSSVEELESYLPFTTATTQWNENFDLDIAFLPHPEEKGYIFSLTLHPNFDISQYSLKHDILFIIDCSTRKHRFESYKRAVIKALTSLQQGDSFNIYIVDKKQTQLHTTSLPVNAKTIREAEQFLEQQSKSFSSRADIFTTLNNVLLDTNQNNSVHTAILVTDGLWRSCAHKQQNELKKWVETNAGRLSVYTAAVGQGNDLVMLDLLSSISGGKLLWSDTHAAFPRKLAKLILDLKDPIATDLSFDAIAMHSNTHIKLSEKSFTPPALFSHQPYVICGQIDRPGPFELLIQGRHGDQWIAIRKNVSFMEGKKADRTLIDKWSSSHAQHTYAKFLQDGKNVHLKEARDILKRSRTQVAFE